MKFANVKVGDVIVINEKVTHTVEAVSTSRILCNNGHTQIRRMDGRVLKSMNTFAEPVSPYLLNKIERRSKTRLATDALRRITVPEDKLELVEQFLKSMGESK
jgi:hypothetical protein